MIPVTSLQTPIAQMTRALDPYLEILDSRPRLVRTLPSGLLSPFVVDASCPEAALLEELPHQIQAISMGSIVSHLR